MGEPPRIGFLGAGLIATYHSKSLRRSGALVERVGVYDPDSRRAAAFADASGHTAMASEDDVLDSSDAPTVATVNTTGLVTAIAPGLARISATSDGKVGTATIMVISERVASVHMTPTTASLTIGDTQLLTTTARTAAGALLSGRLITWQSGAPGVATVSSSGLVTAVSPGVVVIVTTVDGVTATATITVNAPPLR